MKLEDVCRVVAGKAVCGRDSLSGEVAYGFASDLMSDVLTLKTADFLMITGLANVQSVRTAEMSDVQAILLCRGKQAGEDMLSLARDNGMVIIESPYSVFKAAGLLYNAGLKAVY